jgi:serine/threonine protein kinase
MTTIIIGDYSYNEKDELGRGASGVTYLGKNNTTNVLVTIKINSEKTSEIDARKSSEIDALKKLYEDGTTSPYVMQYYDNFITNINGELKRVLVLEYIEGEELELFYNFNNFKNPIIFWRLIYQLLKGIEFIHSKGLSHRDIGVLNIMLTKLGIVKYIDFSESCLGTCPQDNKDCQNLCDNMKILVPYQGLIKNSLVESQREDLGRICNFLNDFLVSRNNYFKFIKNTSLKNNYCNLAEVKQDDRSEQFVNEMFKLTNTNVERILALFEDLILSSPYNGRIVTVADLTQPLTSQSFVPVGNYSYSKKNKISTNYNSITYLGYNRNNTTRVSITFIKYGVNYYGFAMNEIDVYEKLCENGQASRCVVKYYGSFLTETGLYLVTEYIKGDNLINKIQENKKISLLDPIFNWSLMYQLILGAQFITDQDLAKMPTFSQDVILIEDGILKYAQLRDYCFKICPKSNKNCLICEPSQNEENSWDLIFLYDRLKLFLPDSKRQQVELPQEEEYIRRTQSFLDKVGQLMNAKNVTPFKIRKLFWDEFLAISYQGYYLNIDEDHIEKLPLPIGETVDYIITKLYNPNTEMKEIIFTKDKEDFRVLEEYYTQIRHMAISESKLILFNQVLRKCLLENKQEQFRNFPSRQIFVAFYTLCNKIINSLVT